MGISGYYKKILQKYPQIVSKYDKFLKTKYTVDNYYFDSNSIIYDVAHELIAKEKEKYANGEPLLETEELESQIIEGVYKVLMCLASSVVCSVVYIAFDGIPIFAKMVQQRKRRYMGKILKYIESEMSGVKEIEIWDTCNITVGTPFMKKLNRILYEKFKPFDNIIMSGSDECGEGELKMFNHIRDTTTNESILIYGLDADLIIISMANIGDRTIKIYTRENILDINKYASIKASEDSGNPRAVDYYVLMSSCVYGNDYVCGVSSSSSSMYSVCSRLSLTSYVDCMYNVYVYYKYGVGGVGGGGGSSVLLKDVKYEMGSVSHVWSNVEKYMLSVENPISDEMLLDYVMPPSDVSKIDIDSSFKRELWQCSPILPEITYEELCLKHGVDPNPNPTKKRV